MVNRATLFALIAATTLVSGCEDEELFTEGRDPSIDNVNLANAAAAPVTPVGSLPAGSVTYDGVLAAAVAGDYVGSLYADIALDVDFASGAVGGQVSNVDLVDDFTGAVAQDLTGTLPVTGTETAGTLAATASGTLTGVGEVTGAALFNLLLAGQVRSDVGAGDTIYGVATGTIIGDFDLTLTDGEFFGTGP